jgi:hypothetical protein
LNHSPHYQPQRDKSVNNLNDRLARLWPEEDSNGHDNNNLDQIARQLYEEHREMWYFHDSSWNMRGLNKYDGQGCNQFTGCIPECVYTKEGFDLSELEIIKNRIRDRDREIDAGIDTEDSNRVDKTILD